MTKREMLCAYGNCTNWMQSGIGGKITITESHNGTIIDKQSFCCEQHAMLWLQNQLKRREQAA